MRRLVTGNALILTSVVIGVLLAPGLPAWQRQQGAQQVTPAEVERRITGMWELIEWYVDGQVLKPPVISGRALFRDGQVLAIFHRDNGGVRYDWSGYGSYSLNQSRWTYGYSHTLEVTRKAKDNTVVEGTREQTPFAFRLEGSKLILDDQKGDRSFVFESDEFVYFLQGQRLRKWRRLKT
jgi:hypothetical protein